MITSVGTTAIQIGKTLDALAAQLTRAQASSRVVSTYLSLRENDKVLNELRRRKMSVEEAKFVRSLLQICRDVDIKGSQNTRGVVEKFSEQVERDVLADFDAAYREADTTTMSQCATILAGFNGGASVHRAFVNQHDFFIRRDRIESEDVLGSDEIWQVLPDPDAEPPGLEPSLVSLFRDIRKCVKDEFAMMNHIFPEPVTVKNMFLQRVFAQSIQARLEDVLSYAENTSTLAYLRTLQATHSIVEIIVESIKNLQSSTPEETISITVNLETQQSDLFVPYLEGGRYLEKERKSLTELYSSLLYKFTKYHNDRRNQKTTNYFDRVVGKMSVGREEGRVGALFRLAGLERKNGSVRDPRDSRQEEPEFEVSASDANLKVDAVKRMLKWHAEAIGRTVELTSGVEIARDALALMVLLFDFVARDYMETWLDRALDDLIAADTRIEPEFLCFPGIRDATAISRLLYSYVDTVLIPLAGTNLSIRREMLQRQQSNTKRLDGKINALVQRTIDAVLNWFQSILSRQKKADYKPREEDMMNIANMQTQTNSQAQAFLFRVGQVAHQSLTSGGNREAFLTEVGVRVHYILLDHFKKFSVSAAGGLLLTKDIARYQETIQVWSIATLDKRFKVLLEIGNIFVVKPEVLRSLMMVEGGELSKIKAQHLVPYMQCREDYYTVGLSRLLFGGSTGGAAGTADGAGGGSGSAVGGGAGGQAGQGVPTGMQAGAFA